MQILIMIVLLFLNFINTGIEMATRSEKEKLRMNFYKSNTLFVDIVANTKRALLEHHIASVKTTLPKFIDQHQHELLHMCFGNKSKKVLDVTQLEIMFTKLDTLDNSTDKVNFRFITKQNLSVNDLDITLLRILLVNFCSETLWANCLSDSITLYNLLTEHKHDLYHLWKWDELCCCCNGNVVLQRKHCKISKEDWCALYPKENTPPCANCSCHGKPDDIHVCVRRPEKDITPEHLHSTRLSSLILNRYCSLKKAIENLSTGRNNDYAHAVRGYLYDKEFDTILDRTSLDIFTIAKVCNKENETSDMLEDLINNPLDITEAERNRTFVLHELETNQEFREVIINKFWKFNGKK